MKFSIVTISYNQARFLKQCIDSILSQNYPFIEYIIVDPGSSDGSQEIIKSYNDRIIKIFEKDNGPADGLNKGFKLATGDVFCYLNSDDVLLQNAFISIAKFYREHCDVDIVCGHGHVIDSNSTIKRNIYSDNFNIKSAAYNAHLAIQPSTFFKKNIFKKVGGFNLDNHSNWDNELLIDMALAGAKIEVIDKFLSCYRIHSESITGTGRLHDLHVIHSRKMFEKIMNRPYKTYDDWWHYYYRIKKHLSNPQATIERIKNGPVFGTEK